MPSAPPVETVGARSVRNDRSAPRVVPRSFEATSRTWYVTPAFRPVSRTETLTALDPDPADWVSVRVPYLPLVPYSTHQPVERPFGSTVPPTVAEVGPSDHAGLVTTVGAARVENVWSAPRPVPAPFDATSR